VAGTPKRARMRAALTARARAVLGDRGTALDYCCLFIASGGTVGDLARSLTCELVESVSRPITSVLIHRLAPNASERIYEARRGGDGYLVSVGRQKMRVDEWGWLQQRRLDYPPSRSGSMTHTLGESISQRAFIEGELGEQGLPGANKT
jgi:hypothetical protein